MPTPPTNVIATLQRSLSTERLQTYSEAKGEPDCVLLVRYLWNVALCGALYVPLQNVEVALRNELNELARRVYGRIDWLDCTPPLLGNHGQDEIARARKRLAAERKSPMPNNLLSNVSFSFWTDLVSPYYAQRLWNRLPRDLFPGLSPRNRNTLSGRVQEIRHLRNRVFHHEPLLYKRGTRITDSEMIDRYGRVIEAIRWVSPAFADVTEQMCGFRRILNEGEAPFAAIICSLSPPTEHCAACPVRSPEPASPL